MWILFNGAKIRLSAQPDELRKLTGASGALQLEWQNCSMVPQTVAVLSLYSNAPTIAAPSLASNATVRLERRPHKHSAAIPSSGIEKIGDWAPQSQGFATVRARAENKTLQQVISPDLEDDVRVI
jgi:hypothetical protein